METVASSASRDYAEIQLEGKAEQMEAVATLLRGRGLIPDQNIQQEVAWFYKCVGARAAPLPRPTPSLTRAVGDAAVTWALTTCTSASRRRR
jgi:hypothetical protein